MKIDWLGEDGFVFKLRDMKTKDDEDNLAGLVRSMFNLNCMNLPFMGPDLVDILAHFPKSAKEVSVNIKPYILDEERDPRLPLALQPSHLTLCLRWGAGPKDVLRWMP